MLTSSIEIKRPSWNDMFKFYPNSQIKTIDLYESIGGGLPQYYKTILFLGKTLVQLG